jgi:hypothetical protein
VVLTLGLSGLIQVCVTVALVAWGHSVARRRGGRWWLAMWLPAVAGLLSGAALVAVVTLLVQAFEAIDGAPPEAKARQLSESINGAMGWGLALGGPAWALYFGSIVAFSVGSLRPVGRDREAPERGG